MQANFHLDLDNARFSEQKKVMAKIIALGKLPFLQKNITRFHPHPIEREGKYWYVTKNAWPYAHTKHHYLIIAQEYWTSLEQIKPQAMSELMQHACYLRTKCHAPGGALALRFGNSNYSGATIDHLHWQFIVPDIQASDYQKVHLSIGKDKTKLQATNQNKPA